MKKNLIYVLFLVCSITKAEIVTEYILDTVDSGSGSWPCLFYELNYNSDINVANTGGWYSLTEDESYWREGVGPFSIDQNKFLVTQWQSTVHPILIRRHFTLTAEDIEKITVGQVSLVYSYDENPIIWLNGHKVAYATGWNDNNYATKQLSSLMKKYMVEGDNVLCVSLQQGEGGGHIDYGMFVKYDPSKTGIANLLQDTQEKSIYDLNGRRAGKHHKGVVIAGKRKIIR